ncbi:unnamed protein product [[Candida] boidinii]|nr:unnamed protein product [[Candida] boidinii]GMG39231.1 unnamed protein product [[Candida] boidinii]
MLTPDESLDDIEFRRLESRKLIFVRDEFNLSEIAAMTILDRYGITNLIGILSNSFKKTEKIDTIASVRITCD